MKKILLIGIGGVYNYGCEAIVRGTVNLFEKYLPDAAVFYASYRVNEDKRRLNNCKVTVISRPYNRYSFKNIIRKLLSYLGIEGFFSFDSYSLIKGYDMVLSIGGDIYTLSPSGKAPYSLMKFGDLCEKKGIPYILWGCSVGPFEDNPITLKAMKKHLHNISLIVAREGMTVEYLKSIGIEENVLLAPDPAFFVASEIKKETFHKRISKIAINLSPLSNEFSSLPLNNIINFQTKIIGEIIEKFGVDILLVPHVICNFFEQDDDLRYLEKIKSNIQLKYQDNVNLITQDIGFIETKKQLVKCDLVIAARMHCAINAIAAEVPTLFLSYSRKAIGMSKFVYGDDYFVIPLNDLQSIIQKIEQVNAEFSRNNFKVDIKNWNLVFLNIFKSLKIC